MIKLKDILKETPDFVFYKNKEYTFDGDFAVYTFFIYGDIIDKRKYWIAWDYIKQTIICENPKVEDEINNIINKKSEPFKYTNMRRALNNLDYRPSHDNLMHCLFILGRYPDFRHLLECDGRIFRIEQENKYIISSWQSDSTMRNYRDKLDNMFNKLNINKSQILFERYDSYDLDEKDMFVTYYNFFGTNVPAELSVAAKQRKELEKQLHMKKAQLDKALLNALQSNPKNINDLYVSLEKQLNMPIAKIRNVFGNIPLDKIVTRQLKELYKK